MKRLGAGEGGGAAAAPRGSHSWHLDLQVHQAPGSHPVESRAMCVAKHHLCRRSNRRHMPRA